MNNTPRLRALTRMALPVVMSAAAALAEAQTAAGTVKRIEGEPTATSATGPRALSEAVSNSPALAGFVRDREMHVYTAQMQMAGHALA